MQLRTQRDTYSLGGITIRTAIPQAIHRHQLSRAVERILIVALLAFGLSSIFQSFWTVGAHADEVSDSTSDQSEDLGQAENPDLKSELDTCLAGLKTPDLKPGLHRVIQLVNCSDQTVLGTANAAQQKGGQELPVLPEEGTWIMQPAGSADNANVLTIDIPTQWENTKCPPSAHGMCQGIVGPRFWPRTGCRYDLSFDKAQCETGGCSGAYDSSAARQSASVGTTVAEWTFNEPVANLKDLPPNNWCIGDGLPPPLRPRLVTAKILRISARWMAQTSTWTSSRLTLALTTLSTYSVATTSSVSRAIPADDARRRFARPLRG